MISTLAEMLEEKGQLDYQAWEEVQKNCIRAKELKD